MNRKAGYDTDTTYVHMYFWNFSLPSNTSSRKLSPRENLRTHTLLCETVLVLFARTLHSRTAEDWKLLRHTKSLLVITFSAFISYAKSNPSVNSRKWSNCAKVARRPYFRMEHK